MCNAYFLRRLVYLDADMIVCRNIDHLFDLPAGGFYAVGDCYGGREYGEWQLELGVPFAWLVTAC